jgi:AcrR family transcriptional regulator
MSTRERILEASVALVREQGVRAVSFREVARRAGVSHQAPYHHFGNHHGILREIATQGFTQLADAMASAGAEHEDGMDALMAAGVAYVRFAVGHLGHFRVMFDRSLHEPERTEIPEGARTHEVLVTLAARAHAQGHGAHTDARTLADVCWSTVHGLATLMAEGMLGPDDPRHPGDDTLPERVVHALAGALRR